MWFAWNFHLRFFLEKSIKWNNKSELIEPWRFFFDYVNEGGMWMNGMKWIKVYLKWNDKHPDDHIGQCQIGDE